MTVNERIKKFRIAKKMTQTTLAAIIGVSPNTLSEYESGKYNPSTETIAKLNKLGANIRPPFFTLLRQKLANVLMPVLQENKLNYSPRLSSFPTSHRTPNECWIRSQLVLRNITLKTIAKKAGCSDALVSRVLSGTRHSEAVEAVLAEMLGYPSYKHLWADAFINAKRRAV